MNNWGDMQVRVYILIHTVPGMYSKVAEEASKIKGMKMVDVVTGICDAIAYAEVPDLKALKDLLDELHKLEGIEGTRTGIAI